MSTADDLQTIDVARSGLARLADQIAVVGRQAEVLAAQTAWQSPAAAAFQLAVMDWQAMLAGAAAGAEAVRESLGAVRVRVVERSGTEIG